MNITSPQTGNSSFSSAAKFTIYYEGSDHDKHLIDIKQLADSLAAVNAVLTESASLLNGSESTIKVEVSEDFRAGSFGVDIAVLASSVELLNVLKVLGLSFAGASAYESVIQVLQTIKGRSIDAIETADDGSARIMYEGESIETTEDVAKLVTNAKVRNSLRKMIADPLENPGTDSIKIVEESSEQGVDEGSKILLEVKEDDVPNFSGLKAALNKVSDHEETAVTFLSVDVELDTGWRIEREDGSSCKVVMKDKMFIERLRNRDEPHVFGQPYRVRLETETKTKLGVETVTRRILNVRGKL